jgi:hypothetical protein
MDNLNLSPFYVGQKVIATKDHSNKRYLKGQIFTVHDIMKKSCGCSGYVIRIGNIVGNGFGTDCITCGKSISDSGALWFNSKSFAPIQEQEFKQTTYSKVLEEVSMCDN